jgi:hypothetical protein
MRNDMRPCCNADTLHRFAIRKQSAHAISFGTRFILDIKMDTGLCIYALCGGWRRHNGLCHRHPLKHLILDATRRTQRRDYDIGGGEPTANVINGTSDLDAGQC